MTFESAIISFAALMALGMAGMVLFRDPKSFVHRVFAVAMGLSALKMFIAGFAIQVLNPLDFLEWQRIKLLVASMIPGVWLVFSLCYGRSNYREFLAKWRMIIAAVFVSPILILLVFKPYIFVSPPLLDQSGLWVVLLGGAGYVFHLVCIIGTILVLMNLERTLRYSTGHTRWQVKFMVLGVGGISGISIYTNSLVVLYRLLDTSLDIVNAGALILSSLFIISSLRRTRLLNISVDVYVSHAFLYNSFTIVFVAFYFLIVGGIATLALHFKSPANLPLTAFVVLLSIMGLAAVLLSDRLRFKRKQFISRHFKRPLYDYQRIWGDFTESTASLTQTKDLCSVIAKMVSDTLEALQVSIWLIDEKQEHLSLGFSTAFSDGAAESMNFTKESGPKLLWAMEDKVMPVDLESSEEDWIEAFRNDHGNDIKSAHVKYAVPMRAGGRLVGLLTLGSRVSGIPLSIEDKDLLKTIADQAAANILNIRLSERLREVKEREAFQVMSAFFMHDLKNLASKLSLVTQNLPVHFDNVEYRGDALRTMSQSVSKINAMCNRLSLLSERLEICSQDTDINELVRRSLTGLDGYLKGPVFQELREGSLVSLDPEQIQKVIINLIMNANDAIDDGGQIRVETNFYRDWAELAVIDNGAGMSREFMEKHLFRPFQTTKKQGMGIGLFHCKTIVEAHGGRIEAESVEGQGSTFRVVLPLKTK